MRKAYSYIRFSTKRQLTGHSLKRQQDAVTEYCSDNYLLLDTSSFQDLGVSAFKGKNATEGALSQFLEAVQSSSIDSDSYLLVENLDRLSRQKVNEAMAQFLNIINTGITVVTLFDKRTYHKDNPDLTTDLLVSLLGMQRANEESETKSKRIRASRQHMRENLSEKKYTAVSPFWLKANKTKTDFIVIEERAEIVRTIFNLSVKGYGSIKIADYLNAHDYKPPKAKLWSSTSVANVLKERKVLGEFQPRVLIDGKMQNTGGLITDYFPKVIDEDTYLLSRSQVRQRNVKGAGKGTGRKGKHFSNLFSGFSKCKLCNSNLYMKDKGTKSKPYKYLYCSTKCGAKALPLHLAERFITDVFTDGSYQDIWKALAQRQAQEGVDILQLENKLTASEENLNAFLDTNPSFSIPSITEYLAKQTQVIESLKLEIKEATSSSLPSIKNEVLGRKELIQIIATAFQREAYGTKPEKLEDTALYLVRQKLNNLLHKAFGTVLFEYTGSQISMAAESSSGRSEFSANKESFNSDTFNIFWRVNLEGDSREDTPEQKAKRHERLFLNN